MNGNMIRPIVMPAESGMRMIAQIADNGRQCAGEDTAEAYWNRNHEF